MVGNMSPARLFLLVLILQSCNSAKIFMPIFNHKSHVLIFGNLGRALVDDGHEVWLLTSDKFTKLVQDHKINPLPLHVPRNADFGARLEEEMLKIPSGKGVFEKNVIDLWKEPGRYCEEVLGNRDIMRKIKEEKFDLAIVDGTITLTCMYTIPYKFDIPYITLHTMQTASWRAGVTGMPSIEPDIMTELTTEMDFWQRLQNMQAWIHALEDPFMASFDKYFLQTYVPEKPVKKFYDILRDSEMFLLNYDVFCLDYPRVSAPHYQFLGPSSVSDVKPLPQNVEIFVHGTEHGLVILSLGFFNAWQVRWSILREKMFKALGRLQQRVIVQYSLDDDGGNVPENILLLKYIPQNDLLGNPKTKLFITHGGNNGQNEAVYHGVPMLVIPIMVDQPYAGKRAVAKGYGKYVEDQEAITSDELYEMMQEVINNPSYSANIKKCSRILRSMPSAKERIVFWVNHILEFGGEHLRPPSLDMPLYQVLMLDIVAFYVVIGLVAFHGVLVMTYVLYRCMCKARKDKKE